MRFSWLIVLCLVGGCASAGMQKRSYEVTVRNNSSKPITIWLTKNGPAYEPGWKSPEDIAVESPGVDERIAGVIVPAGRTAETGTVTGLFAPATRAILRVYEGERRITQLLAMSPGGSSRFDAILSPGINVITVVDEGGGIGMAK